MHAIDQVCSLQFAVCNSRLATHFPSRFALNRSIRTLLRSKDAFSLLILLPKVISFIHYNRFLFDIFFCDNAILRWRCYKPLSHRKSYLVSLIDDYRPFITFKVFGLSAHASVPFAVRSVNLARKSNVSCVNSSFIGQTNKQTNEHKKCVHILRLTNKQSWQVSLASEPSDK